jgi:cytochrome c biogenesis protein CcmG, thiol:disulfide interchange protein DsbE
VRAPRALIGLCLTAAIAALAVLGLAGRPQRDTLAKPLPRQALSGRPVTLAGVRGRPVLIVFWASWCDPCAQEAPALERFARGLHGRATLIGVDTNDPVVSDARSFVRHYRWSFPNLRDPEGLVGDDYGITDLPSTYVIDATGHVRQTLRGPQTEQTLERALSAL